MPDPTPNPMSTLDRLWLFLQHLISPRWLSLPVYHLTRKPLGKLTPWLIRRFVKRYQIDLSIAQPSAIEEYATFNDFFTRAIDPAARPLAENGVLSPVDGTISQIGTVKKHTLIQAKGHTFTLSEVFGGFDQLAGLFENGVYCTIYLSPRDYHRIHMPAQGRPMDMVYVPGRLFSVNPRTANLIEKLYARNERVATVFKSEAGPMGLIMVGATFVGSMETVWQGVITPSEYKKPAHWRTSENTRPLARGAELGRFNMGSTVILLFQSSQVAWLPELKPGMPVQMGQALGTLRKARP